MTKIPERKAKLFLLTRVMLVSENIELVARNEYRDWHDLDLASVVVALPFFILPCRELLKCLGVFHFQDVNRFVTVFSYRIHPVLKRVYGVAWHRQIKNYHTCRCVQIM